MFRPHLNLHPTSCFLLIAGALAIGCKQQASAEESSRPSDEPSGRDDAGSSPVATEFYVVPEADALPAENLCTPLWACMQHCAFDVEGTRINQACADAMAAATCEENAREVPPWFDVCFPMCNAPGAIQCNDDGTVTLCSTRYYGISNPRWLTYSCRIVCDDSVPSGEQPTFTCVEGDRLGFDELDACQCDES